MIPPLPRWTLPLLIILSTAQFAQELSISVNVHLVLLQATVRDEFGGLVSNLDQTNFTIVEDGLRQAIRLFRQDDVAVTAGLLVDHSGSMRRKLADVVTAAQTFIRLSHPDDELFIVNFNENVTLGLPPRLPFSHQPAELADAITNTPATGQTALYDAIAKGLQQLAAGTHEKKVLVVISDGGDNASHRKLPDVLQLAIASNALVYTIGVFDSADPDRNPGVLRRLAQATGGASFLPNPQQDINDICQRIAIEIRNQYTLGFISTRVTPSGTFRSLRVKAEAPGHRKLTVRTRDGYFAGSLP